MSEEGSKGATIGYRTNGHILDAALQKARERHRDRDDAFHLGKIAGDEEGYDRGYRRGQTHMLLAVLGVIVMSFFAMAFLAWTR